MTFSPTPHGIRSKRSVRPRGRKPAIAGPCRARKIVPEIFVAVGQGQWSKVYHRAHLRNKQGYLYLCWRQSGTVETFYLGKVKQKSPTRSSTRRQA